LCHKSARWRETDADATKTNQLNVTVIILWITLLLSRV
jgi:hypothetical protein